MKLNLNLILILQGSIIEKQGCMYGVLYYTENSVCMQLPRWPSQGYLRAGLPSPGGGFLSSSQSKNNDLSEMPSSNSNLSYSSNSYPLLLSSPRALI